MECLGNGLRQAVQRAIDASGPGQGPRDSRMSGRLMRGKGLRHRVDPSPRPSNFLGTVSREIFRAGVRRAH
jgi:hypothetical protein